MNQATRFISDGHIGVRTTNRKSKTIIPPMFKDVVILHTGYYLALNEANRWGLLNDKNQIVIPFEYGEIIPLGHKYYGAKKDAHLTLFSCDGRQIADEEFEELESLGQGLFLFGENGQYGVIDDTGRRILPCDFDKIRLVCDGRFIIASQCDHLKCYDRNANTVRLRTRADYDSLEEVDHGFLRTKNRGQSGLAYSVDDVFCIEIIPCQYDSLCKKIVGTPSGAVISLVYQYDFRDIYLLASLMVGDTPMYGFIDWENNIRIPLVYEDAEPFDWGGGGSIKNYTSVELKGKWGIIDRQGKWLMLPRWDCVIEIYPDGLCIVCKNGKFGVYEVTGDEILPCNYDYSHIRPFLSAGEAILDENLEGAFLFETAGKVGLYSKRGKMLIEPVYSDIMYAGEGLCAVCQGDLWGYYDLLNGETVPCQYKHVEEFSSGFGCVHLSSNDRAFYWKYQVNGYGHRYENGSVVDRKGNVSFSAEKVVRLTDHLFWVENKDVGAIVNSRGDRVYVHANPIPKEKGQFSLIIEYGHCFIFDNSILVSLMIGDDLTITEKPLLYCDGFPSLDFVNGLAEIIMNGKGVYMDVDGNRAPKVEIDS